MAKFTQTNFGEMENSASPNFGEMAKFAQTNFGEMENSTKINFGEMEKYPIFARETSY